MRVLFFSRDYTTHDRRFLVKLAESQHQIFFLRLENDGIAYEKNPFPDKVNSVEWPGGKTPIKSREELFALMPYLESVVAQIQPNLIHSGPIQTCGFMTALSGFHPFLAMSWGSDILLHADRDEATRWITQYTLRHSDYFICDCQAVREKAQSLVPYNGERILQFPWGIDLDRFPIRADRGTLRNELGWQDAFVIVSTRSWEPIYGIDILLKAFHSAYKKQPNLRLLLLGYGSMASEIEDGIKKNNLEKVIYRPGIVAQERIPDYFNAADLYMSCTKSDGTSISLLEAMASLLPVLLTDAPGNREWVIPGKNGWLVHSEDAEGFANAILEASRLNREERVEIGRLNRTVIEKRADWNTNIHQLIALYDRIENRILRNN